MRTHTQKNGNVSHAIQNKPRAANQAPLDAVLQKYTATHVGATLAVAQREAFDEDELLQGKFTETTQLETFDDDELLQGIFDTTQLEAFNDDELLQGKFNTAQREKLPTPSLRGTKQSRIVTQHEAFDDDELLQGKFTETTQLEAFNDDELLQGKFNTTQPQNNSQFSIPVAERSRSINSQLNKTGLPDTLKSGIENLSGYSMDDVRVHYNSPKPAQLQALAYTQGTDIHVAPGQEKHLPHEAWHVIQQMQGRVQPTMQLQGVNINDSEVLEREADVMGKHIFKNKSLSKNNKSPLTLSSYNIIQLSLSDELKKTIKDVESLKQLLHLSNTDGLEELLKTINECEESFTDSQDLYNYCSIWLKDYKMNRDFPDIIKEITTFRGDNRDSTKIKQDKGFSWFDSSKHKDTEKKELDNSQIKHSNLFTNNFPSLSESWIYPATITNYEVFCKIFPLNQLDNNSFLKSNSDFKLLAEITCKQERYQKFRTLPITNEKLRSIRGPMAGASTAPSGGQYGSYSYMIKTPNSIEYKRINVSKGNIRYAIYATEDKQHMLQKIISSNATEIDFLTPIPLEWIYFSTDENTWKSLTEIP